MFNFFMSYGDFTPVQTGFVMMNRMIAVIEKEEIQKPGKVPGMIPFGFFIGVNMLNVIKH